MYALTITALAPKSFEKDLALLKRVHKRFRESHHKNCPQISTSSTMGFEVQPNANKHCLHVHTYFSAEARPEFTDEFKIYLHTTKIHIKIKPIFNLDGWIDYCIKLQDRSSVVWTYKQHHEDLFQ